MAGMLAGVECARRRRFHVSSSESNSTSFGSTRRSSFCLYASSHDHLFASSSSMRNQGSLMAECDESRLSAAARQAKKRLDERLQPNRKAQSVRNVTSQQRLRSSEERPTVQWSTQAEVPTLKKCGSKRLKWLKLNWRSSEQDECSVCLEQLKNVQGETIMQLPCAHKFHTNCLGPWLEGNSHCPYCRAEIPS